MAENVKDTQKQIVRIANGAGTAPIEVEYQQGDTVATVLDRAGIKLGKGMTPTLGKSRIKDPAKHSVEPGQTIVVAGMPNNG